MFDIEWEISRLAVSVNFSEGVTVPFVFRSEEWPTKTVIVFIVLGDIVGASSVRTGWRFAFVSLEAVFTCIVKFGICRRLCVVWITTLLFLIKCNPMIALLTPSLRGNVKQLCYLLCEIPVWVLLMVFRTGRLLLVFEIWEGRRLRDY